MKTIAIHCAGRNELPPPGIKGIQYFLNNKVFRYVFDDHKQFLSQCRFQLPLYRFASSVFSPAESEKSEEPSL